MQRRDFILRTSLATAGLVAGRALGQTAPPPKISPAAPGSGVALILDPADPVASAPPAQWADAQLRDALAARGLDARIVPSLDAARPADFCILAAGRNASVTHDLGTLPPDAPEALALVPGRLGSRHVLLASGSDPRGLSYALTEIADAVALNDDPATALHPAQPVTERPANSVRSVMRLFASDVEDKAWYNDRDFWRSYLTLLAQQRFNRFNLALGLGYDGPTGLRDTYFYFAYPFLLSVPGYDVRATNLPDAERDQNLAMLRFISDETAARGLQFQLGVWTHAYQWVNSPNANHVITGLTPQTQAPYSRDALALILKECPNISGVTFRIHGESGVPEGSYDLWKTIFDGCVRSGRPVGLDMHAKGMDQPTIDAALATGLPVTISPKYWAEHLGLPYHQAAIRPTELPTRARGSGPFAQSSGSRSFLRYGYGDLLTEDRKYAIVHRIWPGTQRALLWGDPTFAAGYSRAGSFCGSQGHEIFDPMSFKGRKGSGLPGGRDGYADLSLRAPGGDFEKYRQTYRVWGRLLYNPDTPAPVWQRPLRQQFGPAAGSVELSLANASRILPLVTTAHLPSAANYDFWPEMYVNMSIVDASRPQPYTDTPNPKRFGGVSPLDPQLFSRIEDHADGEIKGTPTGKYSPVEVAQWLEDFSQSAADNIAQARATAANPNAPEFRRLAIDVTIQSALGRFFGQKLRAGVLYAIYERTGDRAALDAALKSYHSARDAYAHAAEVAQAAYVADLTYGENWYVRGHWADRLAAIDSDLALLQSATITTPPNPLPPEKSAALITAVLGRPQRATPNVSHTPPASFIRGQPVNLALTPATGQAAPSQVLLYYRHTNPAEPWRSAPVQLAADGFHASIPADYANSPYPLTYYFEITPPSTRPVLYPGFAADLANQPYFLVRSSASPA